MRICLSKLRLPSLTGRTTRELGWIAAGQIAAAVGGLVGFRLLSGRVTPAVWGEVLVWQTAALLINQVIVGGLSAATLRYTTLASEAGQLSQLVAALSAIMAYALGMIGAVIGLVICSHWGTHLRDEFPTLLLAGALGTLLGVGAIADAMQTAFRQRAIVAVHQALAQWLRLLIAVGLVVAFSPRKETVLTGFLLGTTLVLCSQIRSTRRTLIEHRRLRNTQLPDEASPWMRTILTYGWPFAAWGVLNWMQTSVERLVIEHSLSAHDLGIYGAASQLSVQPMTMMWGALMQLLTPIIFKISDVEHDLVRARSVVLAAAAFTAGVGGIAALTVSFMGRGLAALFVGLEFRAMVHYWPFMLLVAGLSGAAQILSVYPMALHRSGALVWPRIAAATTGIVLMVALVPIFGLPGAIISGAAAALVQGGLHLRLLFLKQNAV